ncbi:MAG TPA: LysR family transcriptional regulator [Bdellovibrio sp.]|nr:LysR family transcriptional regulator [Bdellovibrio sp.]
MEIFELRYFLAVAKTENIHRASEQANVSPASLSKAIARLEDELSTRLFQRDGRNIRLTDQGRLLQRKASEIVQLEEAARVQVSGHHGKLQVVIAGPEILLSKMGLSFTRTVKKKYPNSQFQFHACSDEEALEQIERGEAHVAFVTADIGPKRDLEFKIIEETKFQTCVGEGHPLFNVAKSKKTTPVEEVLQYPFVSPSNPLFGKVGVKQSLDGWRDDQFPRKVEFLTSSLKILEEVVSQGRAIAYLPDYYCEKLDVQILKISGCPYSCVQKVKIAARSPKDIGWLHQVF